jgi:hypothetical protein
VSATARIVACVKAAHLSACDGGGDSDSLKAPNLELKWLARGEHSSGLWFIVVMVSVNVLVQIAVRTFEGEVFRRLIFGATVIYTLVFIGHQVNHFIKGEGFDIHTVLDVVHHTLGVWASIAAYRWVTAR